MFGETISRTLEIAQKAIYKDFCVGFAGNHIVEFVSDSPCLSGYRTIGLSLPENIDHTRDNSRMLFVPRTKVPQIGENVGLFIAFIKSDENFRITPNTSISLAVLPSPVPSRISIEKFQELLPEFDHNQKVFEHNPGIFKAYEALLIRMFVGLEKALDLP